MRETKPLTNYVSWIATYTGMNDTLLFSYANSYVQKPSVYWINATNRNHFVLSMLLNQFWFSCGLCFLNIWGLYSQLFKESLFNTLYLHIKLD